MSLARRTFRGILWNFADQLGRRGINIIVTLILAHFLVPEEFGLVAVMSAFVAVANSLMESGFRQALIRMGNAGQKDYSTAFFSNLGLGAVAFLIVYLVAPSIAAYYDEPRLVDLVRAGGISVLVNATWVVHGAILSKDLDFRALLVASMPAAVVSGVVAVVLAYLGFGVWALVSQMVLYSLLVASLTWRICPWRPTFEVSGESFSELFGFGSRLFAAATLDTVFRNLYVVVIAKVFATSLAGYYFFAEKIKDIVINQLVSTVQNVTYPALSTVQNDSAVLKDGYRKLVRVTTFIVFPVLTLLAALTGPLFEVLLPGTWRAAVPYLQLSCMAGLMIPLHSLNLNILQVKGKSRLILNLEIIKKAVLAVVLVASIKFGITGVLIGRIVVSVLNYLPNSYFSGQLIDYPASEQASDFMPSLLLALLVGGLTYVSVNILEWPALLELCLLGVLSISTYLAVAGILGMQSLKLVAGLARKLA